MKEKIKHYIKEIAIFIVVMSIFANLISLYKSQELNKEPLNSYILSRLHYDLNDVLIIHFWATWCPTCKVESANIERLSKDFNVITIAVNSSDEDIKNYMEKNHLTFKVINDENGEFSKEFNINAYPTTFIYDKHKRLVFSDVGYSTTLSLYLKALFTRIK